MAYDDGKKIQRTRYRAIPAPPINVNIIQASRTVLTRKPKYLAIPEQTPATTLPLVTLTSLFSTPASPFRLQLL